MSKIHSLILKSLDCVLRRHPIPNNYYTADNCYQLSGISWCHHREVPDNYIGLDKPHGDTKCQSASEPSANSSKTTSAKPWGCPLANAPPASVQKPKATKSLDPGSTTAERPFASKKPMEQSFWSTCGPPSKSRTSKCSEQTNRTSRHGRAGYFTLVFEII